MIQESIGQWMRRPTEEPQQGPQLSPEHNRRVFEQFLAERDAYHAEADARIRERPGLTGRRSR